MDLLNQDPLVWEIILIIFSLIMSAFFSGSETALTSITPTRTMQLINENTKSAKYLKLWFTSPGKILTTILIGNNLVNILATALATSIAERIFSNNGIAIAVGIMTFLILTFSEIFPKIFARQNAIKLSVFLLRFLVIFYYIFYPITTMFVYLSEKVFKSTGLSHSRRGPLVTLKDLDFFISLAQKEGSLTGSKGMYLQAVSEFSELKVKNIMIPKNKVSTIELNIEAKELIKKINKEMFTRYPVINNKGTFVGILHVKDFLINIEQCKNTGFIGSILKPVFWTNEYMKIDHVLEQMKRKKNQMFLVKDEYNHFAGIITMEDILEELVGEIEDEHDKEEVIETSDKDTFIIFGDESLHDINDKYNLQIPEDKDFQTFNGYLLEAFNGVLPKEQTIVILDNLKIKILKNKDKNVYKTEVTLI
jgi:putative hemolysin